MYKKSSYKLSFLERKKEQDQIIKNKQKEKTSNEDQQITNDNIIDQYIFGIRNMKERVPYIFCKQIQNSFIINNATEDLLQIIKQYSPVIITRFCHTQEEGNIITHIYKFKSKQFSISLSNLIKTTYPQSQIIWCIDPNETNQEQLTNIISLPQSPLIKTLIDRLAKNVVKQGYYFEKYLSKINHPHFEFLKHHDSTQYRYYRWMCIQQAAPVSNKENQLTIQENGFVFIPPSKYAQPKLLPKQKRLQLNKIITNLVSTKRSIAELMVFALMNSNCSFDIAFTICYSLVNNYQSLMARFYAISDIMHNSLALNYPAIFKILLPNFVHKNCKQLNFEQKKPIIHLFSIWKQKLVVFEGKYEIGLKFTINQLANENNTLTFYNNNQLHQQISTKAYEQIYRQCLMSGIPVSGPFEIHLSSFLNRQNRNKQQRIDGLYDGINLTEDEIRKILSQTVDVMTYHSLDYLKNSLRK